MKDIEVKGSAEISWMYPNIYPESMPRDFLRIGLYHVRASNDIEIEYDSKRDGWIIFMTATVDSEGTEQRREKAFIPAWDDDEVFHG
jgi:hypothetical protein